MSQSNVWKPVFKDDFASDGPDVRRDIWCTPEWHAALPNWPTWNPGFFGRSAVRNPNLAAWGADGQVPMNNSCAELYMGLYNKLDAGKSFLGAEIDTRAHFGAPSIEAVKFEASVKFPPAMPGGVVMAIYAYGLQDVSLVDQKCVSGCRDEIDFEFASNYLYTTPQQVNTNIYVNCGDPSKRDLVIPLENNPINVNDFNTFSIVWASDSIKWYINNSTTPIRTETDSGAIPAHGMQFRINIWVPDSDWAWAYNAALQPSNNPGDLRNWCFLVDYAAVYYK